MAGQKFKGNVRIDGQLNINSSTANRAMISDASKNIVPSTVTSTELEALSGITGDIQSQINAKIDSSEKAANNGVATLDAGGKIPASQLPNTVMEFKGNWNASTNSPTLADGTGNAGDVYLVNVAGTQNLGSGSQVFAVGDWVVYTGSIWEKSINSNTVVSVNGQQGVVVLDTDDIAEGSNLYYTDERAQDGVGAILVDSASVNLSYNDATPSITADVIPGGVDHDQLLNYVANEHIDHSGVQIVTAAATSGLTGGGDITTTRNLSVDIDGTTAETAASNADKILIWDSSASALKSQTRGNFLAGIPTPSPGDISETAFVGAEGENSPVNVTGLAFSVLVVRSFKVHLSVAIDADTPVYEAFEIIGLNKGGDFEIAVTSVGDDSLVAFSVTPLGQIQYISGTYSGFVSMDMKFRAITTSV